MKLAVAAARMRRRFVDQRPKNAFLILPEREMTPGYFANYITALVAVKANMPTPDGNVRVRVFAQPRSSITAQGGGETLVCSGLFGGTYRDVTVSWLAYRLSILAYARAQAPFRKPIEVKDPNKRPANWKIVMAARRIRHVANVIASGMVTGAIYIQISFNAMQVSSHFTTGSDPDPIGYTQTQRRKSPFESEDGQVAAERPIKASALPSFDLSYITIPDDKAYEWKRWLLYGEPDRDNLGKLLSAGWRYVPAKRHPEVPSDDPRKPRDKGRIIMSQGMVLMEVTKKLHSQMRLDETQRAVNQVQATKLNGWTWRDVWH